MEKEQESFFKSFLSGVFSGVFLLLPMGSFGGLYTCSFMQNFLSHKPKKKWILLGLLLMLGILIGTLPRLLLGVNYITVNLPLASYLFFGFASLGLVVPIIAWEIKREKKTLLERILFPSLLAVGFLFSFLLYFLLDKQRENVLGDGFHVMLLVGFLLGFTFLVPGLPLKPILSSMGLTQNLTQMMTNIPDNIDRMKSFLSIFLILIGLLINIAIFYIPLKMLFKSFRNVFGGMVSGLMLGNFVGAFVSHGSFTPKEFPAKYSGEIQNIANWGFALFGIFLAVIMFFAFSKIIKEKEDINLSTPLYEANVVKRNKKRFLLFRKSR